MPKLNMDTREQIKKPTKIKGINNINSRKWLKHVMVMLLGKENSAFMVHLFTMNARMSILINTKLLFYLVKGRGFSYLAIIIFPLNLVTF